jgi:retron-type reverse transcriptase
MLEEGIDDRAFVRLVGKWLKAGVLEDIHTVTHPATGTPQGGVISPILANIYLHYALRENRTPGSVLGAPRKGRSYRDELKNSRKKIDLTHFGV